MGSAILTATCQMCGMEVANVASHACGNIDARSLRIIAEWEHSQKTAPEQEVIERLDRELKQARANHAAALRTIEALRTNLGLAQSLARPLSAADLAVQWGLPLTQARRVWRVLTEKA